MHGGDGLVERGPETAALVAALDGPALGDGRVMLVSGPAGIGKSRLLAVARDGARARGATVLTGRGVELERDYAFGLVRQLLEPALARAGPDGVERLFAGAAAPARFLLGTPDPASGEEPSFAVLHGLYWVVAHLADRGPVVLVVDDLHWVDVPSLRFLAYLQARLEGLPVLVVGALRPDEPGADARLLGALGTDHTATVLTVGPLSPAGTAALVERLWEPGPPSLAAAVHDATGGVPFLVASLVSALRADGADPAAVDPARVLEVGGRAVARHVDARLRRLPPAAEAVARAVALLGPDTPVELVRRVAALEGPGFDLALRDLARSGILAPGPGAAFVHALVAAAVLERMDGAERAREHGRAARILTEAGVEPERIAAQLTRAHPAGDADAVATLRAAARTARGRGAPDVGYGYLERALREPPAPGDRVPVLVEAGDLAAMVDVRTAVAHLTEALAAAPPPVRPGVAVLLTRAQQLAGEHRAAIGVCDDVLTAGVDDPGLRLVLEAVRAGVGLIEADTAPRALERLASLRDLRGDTLGHRLVDAMVAYTEALGTGDRVACLATARRAVGDGRLIQLASGGGMSVAVSIALGACDPAEALTFARDAVAHAHRHGSLTALITSLLLRSHGHRRTGALGEAETDARECLRVAGAQGHRIGMLLGACALAQVLVARGDAGAARAVTAAAAEAPLPPWNYLFGVADALAEVALAAGAHEEALDRARAAARMLVATDPPNPAVSAWRQYAADALTGLGRPDEARALAEEELALARRWGAPHALARALLSAARNGDRDLAQARLEEAVAVAAASSDRLGAAAAHVDLGAALRRRGRRAEAREHLRAGLDAADVAGATGLAERARSELRASGARPRRAALTGVGALTDSERRIAERAARGETNREIAQALFVTGKTVEVHLTNAYRKLGVRGRRDLGAVLAAEGAAPSP